jgi:uncharacterized membrane-anchored protein
VDTGTITLEYDLANDCLSRSIRAGGTTLPHATMVNVSFQSSKFKTAMLIVWIAEVYKFEIMDVLLLFFA